MTSAMAKHILVRELDLANKIKERLDKGEDFSALAKKHSICPSGKRGGDLGEINKGDLVKPVEQVIFKKKLKQVHGPTKSKFGYHLIYVYFRD